MPVPCAGKCGRQVVPVQADDAAGSPGNGPWYCAECFERKSVEGETIFPPDGFEHFGCPTCGSVTTCPTNNPQRLMCPHNGSPVWGAEADHWSLMIPVKVVRS